MPPLSACHFSLLSRGKLDHRRLRGEFLKGGIHRGCGENSSNPPAFLNGPLELLKQVASRSPSPVADWLGVILAENKVFKPSITTKEEMCKWRQESKLASGERQLQGSCRCALSRVDRGEGKRQPAEGQGQRRQRRGWDGTGGGRDRGAKDLTR